MGQRAAADDRHEPDAGRLRAFLRWLAPVVYGFGLVEVVAYLLTGAGRVGWGAVLGLAYGIVLIWAWRATTRGAARRAVVGVWLGLMVVGLLGAIVQPSLYPALVIVPIVAVGIALPYERGARLVRVVVAGWVTTVAIAAIGVLVPADPELPALVLDGLRMATIAATAGLALVLLAQHSDRLTGALVVSEEANEALRVARTRLEEEWERLEIILRSIHDAVIATDGDGRLAFLNPVAETLTGWAANEAIGRPVGEVLDVRESGAEVVAAVLASGSPVSLPDGSRLVDRDGTERSIAAQVAPLHDAVGRTVGAVLVFRDVTRAIEAEAERRRIDRRISEAHKLESLAQLAGGVAHDFNNLLVSILGNASLALSDLPPDAPARESIEEIEVAGRRAADLARQMLAFSGRGRLDVGPIDVNALVEEVEPLLRSAVPRAVAIELALAPDLPPIEGDAGQLRQVVLNLGVNAGEAIGEVGGRVTIATRRIDAGDPLFASGAGEEPSPAGSFVAVEVADTGPGMDAATRERVFDPFFSTKFAGRGLGLAAVLGIVRGHGGTVAVESEPGHGSRFRVLLPAEPAAERPAVPVAPRVARASTTVLVVDDEASVRAVARAMLARAGHEVIEAADGEEGVARFGERPDDIDVVLLDLTMPRLGGAEALERIRAIRPDARVVLTSGFSADETGQRPDGGPAAGFLQKPFTIDDLETAVRAALERG